MKRDSKAIPRYFLVPPISATVQGSPARVVDLGLRGARLELVDPLEPGSGVDLRIDSVPIRASVLWCQIDALGISTDQDGYLAGVAFEQASTAVDDLLTEVSGRGGAIRIEEMRTHDRYCITAPLTGTLGDLGAISIIELSAGGARVAAPHGLVPGSEHALHFQVDAEMGSITVPAAVIWSKPSPISRDHQAGLRIDRQEETLRAAIHRLCKRNEARIDLDSLRRKFDALRLVAGIAESAAGLAV